jgi:hypothetical protein
MPRNGIAHGSTWGAVTGKAKSAASRKRTALAVVAVVAAAAGIGVASARTDDPTMLLGSHRTSDAVRGQIADRSVAFRFTASHSGRAGAAWVYIARPTHASLVWAALYTSDSGHPRTRIATGLVRHFKPRRWVRIGLGAAHLHAGSTYWLALIGANGRLAYRIGRLGACGNDVASIGAKGKLPRHWPTARTRSGCRPAVYLHAMTASAGSPTPPSSPPPPPTTTTTTTTPTTTTPTAPGTQKNCIKAPSACGYPDATNAGVPAGTPLTPRTGNIVVSTPGATVSGIALTGGDIEVTANNVTIKNVSVTNGGSDSSDIHIDSGVTGTLIEDSTLSATGTGIAYGVFNGGGSPNVGLRLYMTNCAECWNGNGTLQNSYAISNANISGAHYEAVYIPGGTTTATVIEHNTLLNPNNQTAGIFGDDHAWGPMHNVTIDSNLVADGGDNGALVTGCNGDGNTNMIVTNNRLSFVYDSSMSPGSSNVPATTWKNNVRDDTLKIVNNNSAC